MPQLIHASPVAVRVRAHRARNTIRRQLDVIHRCESLQEIDIDDETFPEMLDEIVSDLGVSKEAVADALDVNLATLYRWLKRKNLPLAFARPILLQTLATLLRTEIDEGEARLLDDRRARPAAAEFDLPPETVQFLPAMAPKGFALADEAILYPFEGPFGDISQSKDRPTFAAFAWRGAGTFVLVPAAAVAEAYLTVTSPGMSYFCHRAQVFVPIDVTDGVGQLLVFLAKDARDPALPPIILRTSGQATGFGTLVLTSGHGVPYDIIYQKRGKRVCIYPLLADPADPPPLAEVLGIAIPRQGESMAELLNLAPFVPAHTGSGPNLYDHARALELNNFEIYHDRRQQGILDAAASKKTEPNNIETFSRVAARIVVFTEASVRFSKFATHICRHEGAELLVPLYGSIDAHLIDPQGETIDAHKLADRRELQLGEVIGDGELYEPYILLGPSAANGNVPDILAINPNRTLHGFTGLSRKAALLAFTVRNLAKRSGWTARSSVDCVSDDDAKVVHL